MITRPKSDLTLSQPALKALNSEMSVFNYLIVELICYLLAKLGEKRQLLYQ